MFSAGTFKNGHGHSTFKFAVSQKWVGGINWFVEKLKVTSIVFL